MYESACRVSAIRYIHSSIDWTLRLNKSLPELSDLKRELNGFLVYCRVYCVPADSYSFARKACGVSGKLVFRFSGDTYTAAKGGVLESNHTRTHTVHRR